MSPTSRPLSNTTLWSALDLDAVPVPVVAIVGGGGKTSLLYRLGREAAAAGRNPLLAGRAPVTPAAGASMPYLVTAAESSLPAVLVAAFAADAVAGPSAG